MILKLSEAGKKGGLASAKKLSKEKRSERARLAANTRWERYRDGKLNWQALRKSNCPKCGAKLLKVHEGHECTNKEGLCGFFLSNERAKKLVLQLRYKGHLKDI